jgi:hypothetical protein
MQTISDSHGLGYHGWYSNSLWAGRSGDRILVGPRLFTPINTGPESHPASCTVSTSSLPGLKRPGHSIDQPPESSAEVKENVELYLYSHSEPSWPVIGWTLPLLLFLSAKFILVKSFCSNSFHNWSLNLQLTLTYTTTKFRITAIIILLVWGLKFWCMVFETYYLNRKRYKLWNEWHFVKIKHMMQHVLKINTQ